jgi:hypothetical protein
MAPQNGKPHNGNNSKPRRPGGSKLAQSSKPLPAIPLPYVKRQAARANAASAATQKPDAPSPSELKLTNGNAPVEVKKAGPVAPAAEPSSVSSPVSTSASKASKDTKVDSAPKSKNDTSNLVTSHNVSVASVSEHPTTQNENTHKNPAVSDRADQPTINQIDIGPIDNTTDKMEPNGAASKAETKPQDGEAPQNSQDHLDAQSPTTDNQNLPKMKSRPPPGVPHGRYQMPPAFQPSGRPVGPTANGDMRGPRPLLPNGPPLHQSHHSNGSVHFGAFHGSTSSSPAPLSGGIAPPPGMLAHNGQLPYMPPGTNGFSHMMPYRPEHVTVTTTDNFGRPTMAYAPLEPFPPHSYHDSQTSGLPDDFGGYNHFASPVPNGVSGPGEDSQSPNYAGRMFGGHDYPQMMPNTGPPPPMMPEMDDAEGLIDHFQRQFSMPEFADCSLELQFKKRRIQPFRIPGHRIVLSRSPELAGAMLQGLSQPSNGTQLPILLVETESKWIQPDPFYHAIQRLYGLPLLNPASVNMNQGTTVDAGLLTERFDFALGYAASGHFLRYDAVTRHGCRLAMELLDMQTVEKALEFALEGHRDEGTHDVFNYGVGSRVILGGIVSFIVNNIHHTFKLDTSVTDPLHYARLPAQATLASNTNRKLSPPPIARGTSVHLKGRRSQQISGIQFGDLSSTESVMSPGSDASGSSQPQRTSLHAILSRILLNLPFETLKLLLESVNRNRNAWPNAEAVFRAVKDTVTERERRRLQIVEMVKNREIPQWEVVSNHLSSPEPRNYIGPWGALGWQEEVVAFASQSPALSRTWTPLANPQVATQAAYP